MNGARDHLSRRAPALLAALALLFPLWTSAQKEETKPPQTAAAGDPVLQAMLTELERSKAQLKMEGVQAPYYIEYRVSDYEEYDAEAAFGALRRDQRQRTRVLRAVIRVGDYKQDSYYGEGLGWSDILPLDDDPLALRHQLWLATDEAYKAASEALTAKQALLKEFSTEEEPVDDFARTPTLQFIGPLAKIEADPAKWRVLLEKATAMFRTAPDIQSLEASLKFTAVNTYFVNSEGTVTRRGQSLYQVILDGSAQAPDGMRLTRTPFFLVGTPAELPSEEKLLAETGTMIETLKKLREAPIVAEEYRGPVVFDSDAASEVLNGLVGSNIIARKLPPGRPGRTSGSYGTSYKSRVLPDFVSLEDDPTMTSFNGQTLVGSYKVDDEGVSAAPVTVVDKGVLVSYLVGRLPIKGFSTSNGHGRAAPGSPPGPSVGNLILRASQTFTLAELKKKMLDLCREQGRPYGYFVKTLGPQLSPRLLYRVWEKDGREELVRGAIFGELDARELRNDLIAVGSDPLVSNQMGAVPSTVICPSMLFDELEVKRASTSKEKLPEYPPPALSITK